MDQQGRDLRGDLLDQYVDEEAGQTSPKDFGIRISKEEI
jgi:hypothetical protein